jgi:glycine/D-amino acid oxidase-like deaminating enzyme
MASLTAVVIGAGALGASTAYHLARRGVAVTLVDQHAPGSQTSPRAAGLTNTKAVSTEIMARLTHEATETLARFERETGHALEFHRSGSVKAAYTETGEARLHADIGVARSIGVEVDLISATDARRLAPWFEPGSPRAIGYVPSDAYLEPSRLPVAYVQLAQAAGAQVRPFTPVTGLLQEDGQTRGVATPRGDLHADVVVDAAAAGPGPASALHHGADLLRSTRAAGRSVSGGQCLRPSRARRLAGRWVRRSADGRGSGRAWAGVSDRRPGA